MAWDDWDFYDGWDAGEVDRFNDDPQYLGPSDKEYMFAGMVDEYGNPVDPYEEREKYLKFSDRFGGYNPDRMTLRDARRIKDLPQDELDEERWGFDDKINEAVGSGVNPEQFGQIVDKYEGKDPYYMGTEDSPMDGSMQRYVEPEAPSYPNSEYERGLTGYEPPVEGDVFTEDLLTRYQGGPEAMDAKLELEHNNRLAELEKKWGKGADDYNTPGYDPAPYIKFVQEEMADYKQRKLQNKREAEEFSREVKDYEKQTNEFNKQQKEREAYQKELDGAVDKFVDLLYATDKKGQEVLGLRERIAAAEENLDMEKDLPKLRSDLKMAEIDLMASDVKMKRYMDKYPELRGLNAPRTRQEQPQEMTTVPQEFLDRGVHPSAVRKDVNGQIMWAWKDPETGRPKAMPATPPPAGEQQEKGGPLFKDLNQQVYALGSSIDPEIAGELGDPIKAFREFLAQSDPKQRYTSLDGAEYPEDEIDYATIQDFVKWYKDAIDRAKTAAIADKYI
jgi:hypothetical protein